MFRLIPTSDISSDCTISYDIAFDREYTLIEFIKTVFENFPDEWGRFLIRSAGKHDDLVQYIDYKYGNADGKMMCDVLDKYGDRKIKTAYAIGGWTKMDYAIQI